MHGTALLAAGMLVYPVIARPGYLAELGQWALVGMFTLVSIVKLLRAKLA